MTNIFEQLKVIARPKNIEHYELIKEILQIERQINELESMREELLVLLEKNVMKVEK